MGFLDRLAGVQDVGRITIRFREDGDHQVTVTRDAPTPAALDAAAFDAALFLYYAAKVLHALGSGPAADELRQHIALSGITLRMGEFEPFTSLIDRPGECVGRLQMNRSGALSINTSFQVPIADTNNYVLDSALLALSRAVSSQPTAEHRGRLAHAIETLEQYYQSVANPSSLKALREAAAVALEVYRRTNAPTSNDAV